MPGTTTDGGLTAAASCTRPGPTIPSPTSRGSGSSADPYSAASSTNTCGPRKPPVQVGDRVLAPHRCTGTLYLPAQNSELMLDHGDLHVLRIRRMAPGRPRRPAAATPPYRASAPP